ncbi:Carboxysome shell and ethanolamine utilization microcompartment protein CcmL/EutN [Caldanaerovirga acetigignens]|uniref:Carboxysome shell and ethanolamine utilization microcompartment protein CcmL/EutN n=1 Tax=Caldanaerovirga acetigignens TaxID=447595 RepID=A0A1M7MBZ0_9FIRM|nr:BMC domain-containing protein [Caldanaerovirga acetigignens]SHM88290.1 Carboxysome shell and ethanolamine utilization microcompartment protein CcmL/EutN [Caldanaerovirga acetigignens]
MKALGLLEFREITRGLVASDKMLKSAPVELITATSVCPGKFVILITGEVSAVKNAIQAGKEEFKDGVIDELLISNPHESLLSALSGTTEINLEKQSLGLIETFSVASAIKAADAAAKGGNVVVSEVRLARGMGGKSVVIILGEVSAVKSAVSSGIQAVEEGLLVSHAVISNVTQKLLKSWV